MANDKDNEKISKEADKSKVKKQQNSGIHDGHRERLRNRIRQYGINSLEEHEILEYILFHFIPRKDVNALAHNMIKEFGNLYNVLSAEVSRLEKIPNITKNAALFLSSFTSIYDLALISREKENVYLKNTRDMIDYAAPRIADSQYEKLLIVLLDVNNKVIGEKIFTNKNNKSVIIKRQQIITSATDVHAEKVIMAHNHPSGDFYPSEADIEEAKNVKEALSYIGITLVDSLILTSKRATTVNITSQLRSECRPFFMVRPTNEENLNSELKEVYINEFSEVDIERIDDSWLKEKGIFNIN